MSKKTMVITGASNGIGLVTAKEVAKSGARTILVCRSKERGEASRESVIAESKNTDVHLFLADLGEMKSIRKVADEILADNEEIHVLVNNAGAINTEHKRTKEGYELTFAANHLGYYYMTQCLLERLKTSGKPSSKARIVNVASDAHRTGKIDLEDPMFEKKAYSGWVAYSQSKLANILFTLAQSKRVEGTNVTANSLHPGVVYSGFAQNNSGLLKAVYSVFGPLFMISNEKGAQTQIHLALSPEVEGVTGKYFQKSKEKLPRRAAQNAELAEKLWALTESLVARAVAG
ncbi:MAG: SDR family oxidoreductase [Polyangiaceae bacterium]|nr:SDR family oxidoreductase [Polyangiaceae bacterium]